MSSSVLTTRESELLEWTGRADALKALQKVQLPEDLQIPSLPTSLSEFLEAASEPDYDVRELGRIIEQDPGLTVDLLKCVNCAALGKKRPVRTPKDALVRLGIPRARTFLIAAGLRSATLAYESRLLNHRYFWNESLRRALFAKRSALQLHADADLAYMGGLLQDFLLPVLTNQYDTEYIQFMKHAAPKGVTLTDWEWETFGWDHAVAGAYVVQQWNMPKDLLCAIMLHHRMDLPLQSTKGDLFSFFPVALAALLPDHLNQNSLGVEKLLAADARSPHFRLDDLCADVDADLREIAEKHDTPLCLLPVIEESRRALAEQKETEES